MSEAVASNFNESISSVKIISISSVKIIRNSKSVNIEIKVYDRNIEAAEKKANEVYERMNQKYKQEEV